VSLEGLTVMKFGGRESEGMLVVSDAFVELLRSRGGDEAVVEHFAQTMQKPTDGSTVALEKVHNP
jgi:hypothetical protein